ARSAWTRSATINTDHGASGQAGANTPAGLAVRGGRMIAVLRAIDRIVVSVSLGVATFLMALMSCVTFYQVLTRFVFERPSTWSEVTARWLMIWMVYLGLVATLRMGALIAIDLILELVP